MTFICHQEQPFKGKINNVEINDQNQYCATIRVLRKIERIYAAHDDEFQGDIYFPDAFIEELANSLEQCKLKHAEASYDQIAIYIVFDIWFEYDTLVDLEFDYYDDKRFFETLNDGLKNKIYDFKTKPQRKDITMITFQNLHDKGYQIAKGACGVN